MTDVSNLSDPVPRSGNGDELDRMTAVFNRMKERLGLSFTQAREFTLNASHELKTPLTIMHGTLEQTILGATPRIPSVREPQPCWRRSSGSRPSSVSSPFSLGRMRDSCH